MCARRLVIIYLLTLLLTHQAFANSAHHSRRHHNHAACRNYTDLGQKMQPADILYIGDSHTVFAGGLGDTLRRDLVRSSSSPLSIVTMAAVSAKYEADCSRSSNNNWACNNHHASQWSVACFDEGSLDAHCLREKCSVAPSLQSALSQVRPRKLTIVELGTNNWRDYERSGWSPFFKKNIAQLIDSIKANSQGQCAFIGPPWEEGNAKKMREYDIHLREAVTQEARGCIYISSLDKTNLSRINKKDHMHYYGDAAVDWGNAVFKELKEKWSGETKHQDEQNKFEQ